MVSKPNEPTGDDQSIDVLGHLVAISHPDKIFSSEATAIKLELVAYYL